MSIVFAPLSFLAPAPNEPTLRSLEINSVIGDVKSAFHSVEKWAKPERPPFQLNFAAMRPVIYKEPKGIVLIITPFNYPLWLAIPPVVSVILVEVENGLVFIHLLLGWGNRSRKLCSSQAL